MRPLFSLPSRIAISAILLAFIFALFDWDDFLGILRRIELAAVALMICVAGAERIFSAYRWYALVHGKSPSISCFAIFRITFVSVFLGQIVPGSIGVELVRINGLAKLTGDLALSFASVLVERFFALAALAFLVLMGLAISPTILPAEISMVAWLGLILLSVGLVVFMNARVRTLTMKLVDVSVLRFLSGGLSKLYSALDKYRSQPGVLALAALYGLVFQLIRVTLYGVGAWALGMDIPLNYLLVVVPVAVIARLLPISVGGLGIREVSLVSLLGLVGALPEAAVSLSLLVYLMELVAGAAPGALIYVFSRDTVHALMAKD